jgi:hypothetical protein
VDHRPRQVRGFTLACVDIAHLSLVIDFSSTIKYVPKIVRCIPADQNGECYEEFASCCGGCDLGHCGFAGLCKPATEPEEGLSVYPSVGPCHFVTQRIVTQNGRVTSERHQVCN